MAGWAELQRAAFGGMWGMQAPRQLDLKGAGLGGGRLTPMCSSGAGLFCCTCGSAVACEEGRLACRAPPWCRRPGMAAPERGQRHSMMVEPQQHHPGPGMEPPPGASWQRWAKRTGTGALSELFYLGGWGAGAGAAISLSMGGIRGGWCWGTAGASSPPPPAA